MTDQGCGMWGLESGGSDDRMQLYSRARATIRHRHRMWRRHQPVETPCPRSTPRKQMHMVGSKVGDPQLTWLGGTLHEPNSLHITSHCNVNNAYMIWSCDPPIYEPNACCLLVMWLIFLMFHTILGFRMLCICTCILRLSFFTFTCKFLRIWRILCFRSAIFHVLYVF